MQPLSLAGILSRMAARGILSVGRSAASIDTDPIESAAHATDLQFSGRFENLSRRLLRWVDSDNLFSFVASARELGGKEASDEAIESFVEEADFFVGNEDTEAHAREILTFFFDAIHRKLLSYNDVSQHYQTQLFEHGIERARKPGQFVEHCYRKRLRG